VVVVPGRHGSDLVSLCKVDHQPIQKPAGMISFLLNPRKAKSISSRHVNIVWAMSWGQEHEDRQGGHSLDRVPTATHSTQTD
jgi:hypothetical protein